MKKVLVLIPYYYPGFRSGGPQQTIQNVIDVFGEKVKLCIYTQNFDLGETKTYDNVEYNKWIKSDNVEVMYVPYEEYCGKRLEEVYKKFDYIYSCGLFERNSIALLRIHRKLNKLSKKIFIAPMGVFSEGAMKSKRLKKYGFVKLCKFFKAFNNVVWSFTSEIEHQEAEHVLGKRYVTDYIIAEDLPRKVDFKEKIEKLSNYKKNSGCLKIIFLSRICEKKNLAMALDVLKECVIGDIKLDIYGIREDKEYWERCESIIGNMPNNISVKYVGEVMPEDVLNVFAKYDVFLFPTKGENFGHVIYEALAAGCIPVISNTTPWNMIQENDCGSVIELTDTNGFTSTIETYCKMGNELKQMKIKAIKFAERKYNDSIRNSGYSKVFVE